VRLLWVENHAVFVRMAGRQFLAGHEVVVVPSVAGARAALTTESFDAVLVDYDLDDGKGAEVVELVRQMKARPAVVAVSSHADGNAALLAAGADAVCPKTQFAGIEGVLRAALARREA
jgi:CheY-like chemotaxis protein